MPSRDRDRELQELLHTAHHNGIPTEPEQEVPQQQYPAYEVRIITIESGTDTSDAHS
jgi:hypothetical protein